MNIAFYHVICTLARNEHVVGARVSDDSIRQCPVFLALSKQLQLQDVPFYVLRNNVNDEARNLHNLSSSWRVDVLDGVIRKNTCTLSQLVGCFMFQIDHTIVTSRLHGPPAYISRGPDTFAWLDKTPESRLTDS